MGPAFKGYLANSVYLKVRCATNYYIFANLGNPLLISYLFIFSNRLLLWEEDLRFQNKPASTILIWNFRQKEKGFHNLDIINSSKPKMTHIEWACSISYSSLFWSPLLYIDRLTNNIEIIVAIRVEKEKSVLHAQKNCRSFLSNERLDGTESQFCSSHKAVEWCYLSWQWGTFVKVCNRKLYKKCGLAQGAVHAQLRIVRYYWPWITIEFESGRRKNTDHGQQRNRAIIPAPERHN